MKFCVAYDIHIDVKNQTLYDDAYDALSNTVLCVLGFLHAFNSDEDKVLKSILNTTYIIVELSHVSPDTRLDRVRIQEGNKRNG